MYIAGLCLTCLLEFGSKLRNMINGYKHEEAAPIFDKIVFNKVLKNAKNTSHKVWSFLAVVFLSLISVLRIWFFMVLGKRGTGWQCTAYPIWSCSSSYPCGRIFTRGVMRPCSARIWYDNLKHHCRIYDIILVLSTSTVRDPSSWSVLCVSVALSCILVGECKMWFANANDCMLFLAKVSCQSISTLRNYLQVYAICLSSGRSFCWHAKTFCWLIYSYYIRDFFIWWR